MLGREASITEKTGRDLSRELAKVTAAAGAEREYTPDSFRSMILELLNKGELTLEHIVALGMSGAINPISPGGPYLVVQSFANALQARIKEERA